MGANKWGEREKVEALWAVPAQVGIREKRTKMGSGCPKRALFFCFFLKKQIGRKSADFIIAPLGDTCPRLQVSVLNIIKGRQLHRRYSHQNVPSALLFLAYFLLLKTPLNVFLSSFVAVTVAVTLKPKSSRKMPSK